MKVQAREIIEIQKLMNVWKLSNRLMVELLIERKNQIVFGEKI